MSVQLILYPQSYDGEFNSITSFANEFVVDGINFNTINASSSYDSPTFTNTWFDVLTNAPPLQVNEWYRFRTTTSGTPTLPTETSGNLVLEAAASGSLSGVYQKLSNLVAGTTYEMVIDLDQVSAGGFVFTSVYNGSSYILDSINAAQDYQITFTWTAATANDTIVISYLNTVNDTIRITNISVSEQGVTPTLIYTDLEDGQVICDLYEDEDIPLTLSVDDFKNVAEQVQSYSKAFNLPATKRNNLIFDNIFEITRTDTGLNFNPYKKTQCVLKQDGFLLFEGYLRLIDISDKEGEISYNVNLYSEVVALKDVLDTKTLADISFVELEMDYTKTNITRSWNNAGTGPTFPNANTSGFRDDNNTIKFPFVDWSHNYTVDPTTGFPILPNLESSFRPFINIKYLIDRIFDESPFTYESDFFNTSISTGGSFDFDKLYMDFNWGGDENPNSIDTSGTGQFPNSGTPVVLVTTSYTNVPLTTLNFSADFGYDDTNHRFVSPSGQSNANYEFYSFVNTFSSVDAILEFRWLYTPTGGGTPVPIAYQSQNATGTAILTTSITLFTGEVYGIGVTYGGNYNSAPTITINGSGTGFACTVSGTYPGPILPGDITITNQGSGYDGFANIEINGDPQTIGANTYFSGTINQPMNAGDILELQWKSSVAGSAKLNNYPWVGNGVGSPFPVLVSMSLNMQGVIKNAIFQSLRGELKQWEFLKGIITMFNLISIPDKDNPNNILLEPYSNVFIHNTASGITSDLSLASRGIAHDWTDKIDIADIKLKPLTDLNKETIFKFVDDDDDYAFNNYKTSVGGHLYGSKEFDASDFTVLTGKDEIVAEPFAATVPKALMSQFPDLITPAIYSYNADDQTSEGFENAPRIMYDNGIKTITSCTYYIPAQNGDSDDDADEFLQFTHLSEVPSVSASTVDFNFGECQYMPGLGNTAMNNLFNTYWSPYYYELYNPDTRIMTLKVNLSPADINTFNFFDTVMIKNREFRVNKIDYKPNDLATVEFILIP
jgi:hypothetical protein